MRKVLISFGKVHFKQMLVLTQQYSFDVYNIMLISIDLKIVLQQIVGIALGSESLQ